MAEATSLTASAVVINGCTLISNLSWFTEEGSKREATSRAKQLGVETGEDAFTIREVGRVVQYGTTRAADATRKSVVYSLASHLAAAARARKFAVTWAGAFELANGQFAFISVKEDAILPEGDRICDATTARELVTAAIAERVEKILAPADFGIANTQCEAIERFIAGTRSSFRPDSEFRIWRPGDKASQSTKRYVLPIAMLIFACAVGGGWWWWQQQQEADRLRQAELKAREIAARKSGQSRVIVPIPAWEGRPLGTDYLRACLATIGPISKSPAGWAWKESVCEGVKASHSYAKVLGSGRAAQLMKEMPEADVSDAGNAATKFDRLNVSVAPKEQLPDLDDSKRTFLAKTQESLFTGSLTAAQAPQLPSPPPGQTYTAPTWKLRNFTIEGTGGRPEEFLRALEIPGLRVNKLTVSANMRIKVEGTLYAQ